MKVLTHTYRVWMHDGNAGLYNSGTEEGARQRARAVAAETCKGQAMTSEERLRACTVRKVELLS